MLYCYVFGLLRHSTIACVCVFYADMRNKKIFWSQLLGGNWASHGHLTLEVAKFEPNQHTHTRARVRACAHTQTTGCVLQPAVISQLWQPAMVNWFSLSFFSSTVSALLHFPSDWRTCSFSLSFLLSFLAMALLWKSSLCRRSHMLLALFLMFVENLLRWSLAFWSCWNWWDDELSPGSLHSFFFTGKINKWIQKINNLN